MTAVERSGAIAPPPESIPVAVEHVLLDHPLGGAWRPPPAAWIEHYKPELADALASLKAHLEPAPEVFAADCLSRLALLKFTKGSAAEWQARASEYLRLLAEFPPDIWQRACDECARHNRFFPDVSELLDLMQAQLDERHRHIRRLERMLAIRPPDITQPMCAAERDQVARGFRQLGDILKGKADWPEPKPP